MSESGFTIANKINFDDVDELIEKNLSYILGKTGFSFIDEHFGLRPGNVHVLLSGTSSGKTSLARSLVTSLSKTNRVLWYASEETMNAWKLRFPKTARPNIENVKFIAESDLRPMIKSGDVKDPLLFLENQIELFCATVFFFDNITTSTFYNDKKPNEQSIFLMQLKDITIRQKAAMFLIAHLSSNHDAGKMFTSEDVRGNRSLSNIAEYWYNLHRLRLNIADRQDENLQTSILHVEKSRWHDNSDTAYQLTFSKRLGIYTHDNPISWTVVKELFGKNITIGKKK